MSELSDLYQEIILDHCKRPRNFGPLPQADRNAEGYNPLCGDQVRVHVALDGDRVAQVRFEGSGCAISTASASLMTEAVAGKSVAEAHALFHDVHAMLTGDPTRILDDSERLGKLAAGDALERLGKLAALGGVREYPMRVKCATLAWHTLEAALAAPDGEAASSVSTE